MMPIPDLDSDSVYSRLVTLCIGLASVFPGVLAREWMPSSIMFLPTVADQWNCHTTSIPLPIE